MDEFLARENIRRFQAQLNACSDSEQRSTLVQLLESERQRLAQLQGGSRRLA